VEGKENKKQKTKNQTKKTFKYSKIEKILASPACQPHKYKSIGEYAELRKLMSDPTVPWKGPCKRSVEGIRKVKERELKGGEKLIFS
jgi:hypothetical protein